jgi:large subunit ribosomal protein L30
MANTDTGKAIKVTLVKSGICCPEPHKRILRALGLTKRERPIVKSDRPEIRGMLDKVSYLVKVEAAPAESLPAPRRTGRRR